MVNFGDEAVDAIPVEIGAANRSRSPVVSRQRLEETKNIGQRRIRRQTVALHQNLSSRDLRLRWHEKGKVRAHPLALSFIRTEEECSVLDHRSAQRCPEIVVSKCGLLDRRSSGGID